MCFAYASTARLYTIMTDEVNDMKLSQYIYGRKPKAGLQVITRSRELPFFVQKWFESPRYGAAPVRTTSDRIWEQRYELQCFEGGAALSCLYPLKQTEVPCSEQQEPYIRGITPAVQHLLAGGEDAETLVDNIASALYFDGFHHIDEIYCLPSTFSEPVEWTPAPVALKTLETHEQELCLDMASALWMAFMSRKDGKTGELATRTVKLIVPAGTPAEEIDHQRRIAANVLALLPHYIRRWTSLTLGMDVESDNYPAGSAFYGMARAAADSQPSGKGIVYDLEKQAWPAAEAQEKAYFIARIQHTPVVLLDEAVSQLPNRFDLAFHLRLKTLLDALCAGTVTLSDVQTFLKQEKLEAQADLLCPALAQAVLAACNAAPDRKQLASLWMLAQCSPAAAAMLHHVTCSCDDAIAVLVRNGVNPGCEGLFAADEAFAQLIIRLSAADRSPLAPATCHDLLAWLAKVSPDANFVEVLVNRLIEYGKPSINDPDALHKWLENGFVARMSTLCGTEQFMPLLDQLGAQRVGDLLYFVTTLNREAQTTAAAESLLMNWFDRAGTLPAWDAKQCLFAANRALQLEDHRPQWPIFALRCADALPNPTEAITKLLNNAPVRQLPQVQALAQKYAGYVHAVNVNALCSAITKPNDVLTLSEKWAEISGGQPFAMASEQWAQLDAPLCNALRDSSLASLLSVYNSIDNKLPMECVDHVVNAIAICIMEGLGRDSLNGFKLNELQLIYQLCNNLTQAFNSSSRERFKVVQLLNYLHPKEQSNLTFTETFEILRSDMRSLSDENHCILRSLLSEQFDVNQNLSIDTVAASIYLQNMRTDNTIDWNGCLNRTLKYYKLPSMDLNEAANKYSLDDFEMLLASLCAFYRPEDNVFGMILTPADRQTLNDWLTTVCPKLIKKLIKEYKTTPDLPDMLVEGLGLNTKKR